MKYLSALIIYLSLFLVFINSGCNKENPTENIPVQSTPVVSILYPVNTEIIGDSIQIQVSATDDKGVIKVEIYIDNQIPENGILINPPYNYTWKLGNYADSSSHTLFAKAFDGDNNVGSSSVLNLVSFKFAPTKLAAFFLSDSLIKLTWQDNSQKEMGYEIERKTNGENFELVKTVDANITEAEISGIYKIPDVFSFRIRAFNLNQKSRYSNIVSQTLHFPPPTNLSINSISATSLRIDWVDSNFFESGFIIERSANGSSFTFLDSVGKNQSSFTDNFIESENKYEYKIKSYSRFNVSSYSDIIKTEFLVTYSYDYDLIDHTDHVKWVKFSPIEDI
ncbi:MAG: hypothetical protein KDC90_19780, partial [Ignavibacteriae bacterium]|nr:hypothetical protein [Ignavibacteriota bacterium]